MNEDDGLGDWRILASARLATAVDAAYPGGPSHKIGDTVHQSALVRDGDGEPLGFVLPSATALALKLALQASASAAKLLEKVRFRPVPTPLGAGRSVISESNTALFDYFEQCMTAVTFSYQALEMHCNRIITWNLKGTQKFMRRGKLVEMDAREVERHFSTSEKIATVLPRIVGVPSPKGTKRWEQFLRLEAARNATIHMKETDQMAKEVDSLLFQFLVRGVDEYPGTAIDMLLHLTGGRPPRWLRLAHRQLGAREAQPL